MAVRLPLPVTRWAESMERDNMDPNRDYSFVAACMDFFGRKPEQTIQELQGEFKALTIKDREDLTAMLRSIGYNIRA